MSGFFTRVARNVPVDRVKADTAINRDTSNDGVAQAEVSEETQDPSSNTFYLMESVREGARLEGKTDAAASEAQLRMTGLRTGMNALDLGCGTGAVTRVMAKIAAPGHVTGVDASTHRLGEARELAAAEEVDVAFLEGQAEKVPVPDDSFDYAWSRFLFEYLAEPRRALAEMVRVTRPGGSVVVADLDGQITQFYPLNPETQTDLDEGLRLLGTTGFDPWIGRKLYSWFREAGLQDLVVHVAPYQVYAGGMPERDLLNWQEKFATGAEQLARLTGDVERWARFRDRMLSYIEQAEMFYYCTLIIVRGTVPTDAI
jgi:ubiquinone/menaquinone biosynthesis C-methylase UbiE